jgi:hypothetical protein
MAVTDSQKAEITRTIDLYVEGMRNGDGAKLREAFHAQAWMIGSLAGTGYDEPIGELIAMVDGHSVDVDGSFQAASSLSCRSAMRPSPYWRSRASGAPRPSRTFYPRAGRRRVEDRQQDVRPHRR